MTVKITGFADEIAPELTAQIAGLKGLGMSYVEMRGVDGENLIYHTDEKVEQIKKTLDDNGIRLSALGSPLGKILITDDFTPHFEEFKRAVEISHKMECPTIRMFSFYLPQESDPAGPYPLQTLASSPLRKASQEPRSSENTDGQKYDKRF